MKPRFYPVIAALVLLSAPTLRAAAPAPLGEEAKQRLTEHVRWLADDAREGRGIGTAGLDSAALYMEEHFRQAGLKPLFEDSYQQSFPINWGAKAEPGCYLATAGDTLWLGEELLPFGFSASDTARGELLFAGYGISAAEYEYDDYAGLDASGKIVLVFSGEPALEDPDSKFAGSYLTDHASARTKAINARMHGAAGLLIVNRFDEEPDQLEAPRSDEPYTAAGLPVLALRRQRAEALFGELELQARQARIDESEEPASELLDQELTLKAELTRNKIDVANVGALLPGEEEGVIVLGAHFDHLGYGQSGSTWQGERAVHNGADDNGSGSAVLLELAGLLAENPPGPTLWFVAFTGEEAGLVGSSHFVNSPPADLEQVRFMLNIDMVGRIEEKTLTVYGVQSAEELPALARRAGEGVDLELSLTGGGYGASDQTSFYAKGIPVIHLLGTLHGDYHTPRDDWDQLHYDELTRVLDYARRLVDRIAQPDVSLSYVAKARDTKQKGRGLPVSFGIIPDFAEVEAGFRITGVVGGSPAEKAGLTGGDVLLAIGEGEMKTIHDLMYLLRQYKPGDTAEVLYLRNGERQVTEVTFVPPSARRGGGRGGSGPPPGMGQGKQGGHPGAGHPGGSPKEDGKGHPGS